MAFRAALVSSQVGADSVEEAVTIAFNGNELSSLFKALAETSHLLPSLFIYEPVLQGLLLAISNKTVDAVFFLVVGKVSVADVFKGVLYLLGLFLASR